MTADLVGWLRAQLDHDEQVARAASGDHHGLTPTGEHWRWECTRCDTPIPITDVTLLDEFLECPACRSVGVALRSVEEYPTESVGPLSHFVIGGAEEQRPVDAFHLALHEPARVLRQVAAHRAILDAYLAEDRYTSNFPHTPVDELGALRHAVLLIAAIYQDRPGYVEEWKP